jgi:hypothetical protein
MKQPNATLILVIISALLFIIHQYLQMVAHINIVFLDNYLDPAVMMPIVLYAVLWERRILFRNKTIVLPYTDIFGYFVLISVFGEVLFPFFNDRFTTDYWDIVSYAVGSLAYAIAQRASNNSEASKSKSLFSRWPKM